MTLAIVKVLPEPVTPSSVWNASPSWIPSTSPAMASGWSPAGGYGRKSWNGEPGYVTNSPSGAAVFASWSAASVVRVMAAKIRKLVRNEANPSAYRNGQPGASLGAGGSRQMAVPTRFPTGPEAPANVFALRRRRDGSPRPDPGSQRAVRRRSQPEQGQPRRRRLLRRERQAPAARLHPCRRGGNGEGAAGARLPA